MANLCCAFVGVQCYLECPQATNWHRAHNLPIIHFFQSYLIIDKLTIHWKCKIMKKEGCSNWNKNKYDANKTFNIVLIVLNKKYLLSILN